MIHIIKGDIIIRCVSTLIVTKTLIATKSNFASIRDAIATLNVTRGPRQTLVDWNCHLKISGSLKIN